MSGEQPKIARWIERLVAFLIDAAIYTPMAILIEFTLPVDYAGDMDPLVLVGVLLPGAVFMAYLTLMEVYTETTVGRRVMRLRVVAADGSRASIYGLMLSNFGKAFLLLIDVIAGLVFVHGTRQRIFAHWGGVVVVKMPKSERNSKFVLD